MATITFSYVDNLSSSEFLDLAKRYAKAKKKADAVVHTLSWHQDRVAVSLGFQNWSMMHKHLASIAWSAMYKLKNQALKKPGLGKFIYDHAVRTIDKAEAIETMETWARSKYTQLIEFAFYDNESENGFGWPSVDMAEELSAEFAGQFPDELIEKVGNDLDVDEGPWGLEDYSDD